MHVLHDAGGEIPAGERIAVALARMEERQKAIQDQHQAERALSAERHQQVVAMFSGFVPRPEIEAKQEATTKRIVDLEGRVERIEGRLWKAIAWVLGTTGSAVAGAIGLHFKGG